MTGRDETLRSGSRIAHYEITELLGAGGMGEVYLAEDTRLKRKIALKVLPAELTSNRERLQRFEREARAASALNHPNILTVYEFGAEDGTHYLAAEFVAGDTLREKLSRGGLEIEEALDIAQQAASALAAAHAAGIIHRDIKPENVMVREDGLVKVLDFGLAKLSEPPALAGGFGADAEAETRALVKTTPGVVMGTPAYMSPEQARGKETDARTDVFSLGVVLYEMLTRRQPFAGETLSDVIAALLTREPAPLQKGNPRIPAELERIITKSLAKDRAERYESAKGLLTDLRSLQKRIEFEAELERTSPPHESADARTRITGAEPTAQTEKRNSIAVLPFTNMSADADNEYFCDGLAEELLNALAKIDDLKVAARTSAFSFKNKNIEVSEIGNALKVKTILEGSVRKSGNHVRITVQLISASDGYHLWSERYDREMKDIFDVQDEITLAVVDALKVKLLGEEKAAVLKRYTDNTEAYELYLRGLYYFNKDTVEGWLKAIESFQKAVEKEPEYALAYTGMSSCWATLHIFGVFPHQEIIPQWKDAAGRALKIDDRIGEAHFALAQIFFWYEWNWTESERECRRAIELNPNSAIIHQTYGFLLTSRERFDEAISEGKRALELDPLSLVAKHHIAWFYLFAHRVDDALEQIRQMIELDPNFPSAYWLKGSAHVLRREYEEAIRAYQKSLALGGTAMTLSNLGCTYGLVGKRDEALGVLHQLLDMRERQYTTATNIARVYAGLGDNDNAFEWLEKAVAERDGELVFFKPITSTGTVEAWGGSFRTDPRYQDVVRRVGLPTDETALGQTTNETSEARTAILSPIITDDDAAVPPDVRKVSELSGK